MQLLQQIRGRTHGYDSLSLSVLTAQAELEQLSSPNPPASRHRKLHVGHCRLVWELIDLTIQETPLQKIVKANVVKGSLKKLDAITRHAIEGKTVSFYQSHLRRSTPSKRQVDSTAAIRKIIQISDHDRQILNRYLQDAVPVPTQGLVKAPSKLTMSEVKTLLPGRWVDDRIIDAYLKLVCHHGNGLFDAIDQGDDQSARTGTPKYHAWSSLVAEGPGHMDISWPPEQYAAPKIEEVQHHFFPLLVGHDGGERNHWIMLHLWNNAGSWALDCFSSMAGYHGDENWPYLAQELFQMSNRVLDVTTLRPTDPILQPRQINDSDCGALILYVARWIMEGWPIWTIQSDLCGTYRRRLIVELEKWRLD